MPNPLSVAICQMEVQKDKEKNLRKAEKMIKAAADNGAQMVVLPEMFNIPYNAKVMAENAETYPGPSTEFLARVAQENQILLIGGSIAEKEKGRIYNTSFVFDEKGQLIGRHRKLHLFDIDIPGKVSFRESAVLDAGENITVIHHNNLCFALMICYDCRFPELFRAATSEGAQMVIIPAAFTIPTGSIHWDLTMRCRAVDNQVFVLAASPSRAPGSSFQPYGHSMIVDPWGAIVSQAYEEEQIVSGEIDFRILEAARAELPLLKHRRHDIYQTTFRKPGNI